MDLTINNENNAMNSLSFYWFALFNDNTVLPQFEDNGTENKFQKVIDRFADLKSFDIKHKEKDLDIEVDLRHGVIYINDSQSNLDEFKKNEKTNIRLIYFRRHQVLFNASMQEIGHKILYFIGYQYNDKEGQNCKVLLQLDAEGNIIVGD